MQRQTLVVALDDRLEVGVEVEAGELEGLQGAHQRADHQGHDGDADVGPDELLLAVGQLIGGRDEGRFQGLRPLWFLG